MTQHVTRFCNLAGVVEVQHLVFCIEDVSLSGIVLKLTKHTRFLHSEVLFTDEVSNKAGEMSNILFTEDWCVGMM